MGIIRERQQFRNQRIGVVKTSTGEQEVWKTVGQAADRFVSNVMKAAIPKAEQMGEEAAEQVSQENLLRTIDPATGRAEAFTPPKNMGTVAQDAYRNTMRRRYVRTAETEIKDKAQELFIKYQFDPHGPENYSTAMENYLENMVKVTDPTFSETLREVGATYLASTKLNLMQKRAMAIANAEQLQLEQDASSFATSVSDFGSDVNSLNIARQMEEQAQRDALDAGIQSEDQYQANMIQINRAIQQRDIPNALTYGSTVTYMDGDEEKQRPLTSADINLLESAYQALGDQRIVEKLPKGLQDLYAASVELAPPTPKDFDELRKAASLANSNFNASGSASSQNTKFVDDMNRITQKGGDPASVSDQKAVDHTVKALAGTDDPAYYRTDASLSDKNLASLIIETQVAPNGLVRDLKNLASGMEFKDEEVQNLMQHYYRYAGYVNKRGNTQNLLERSLDKEQMGVLEAVRFVSTYQGGTANMPQILSNIVAIKEDQDLLNRKKGAMFKGGPNSKTQSLPKYLMSKFNNDAVMVERYQPMAEYIIGLGGSLDDLDDHIDDVVNSVYLDGGGIVADVLYGPNIDRSMFALERTIPNTMARDLFVMSINADLPDGYHLGEGGPDDSKRVYLVPQDLRGSGVSDEYGTLGVIYNAFYQDELGMLSPVPTRNEEGDPLFMSFSPSEFMNKVGDRVAPDEQPQLATDEQIQERLLKSQFGRDVDLIPFESDMSTITTTRDRVLDYEVLDNN